VHRPEEITTANIIADIEQRWRALGTQINDIYSAAREKVKPHKDLLAFLNEISLESEDLKPSKNIHDDYERLARYALELPNHLVALTELLNTRNLPEFQAFDQAITPYQESLNQLQYLKDFSEK
jgi:hypothetical protein